MELKDLEEDMEVEVMVRETGKPDRWYPAIVLDLSVIGSGSADVLICYGDGRYDDEHRTLDELRLPEKP